MKTTTKENGFIVFSCFYDFPYSILHNSNEKHISITVDDGFCSRALHKKKALFVPLKL
jgi:hypothetical protein